MPATSWKTVRVFISSTFRDMQAERDWLVRFVFPKLREELVKHRIHFVDMDLRWGVTSDQDALGVCREVIDECHPRFMCILGGRYGWVPDGKDKSITADEVHYGVLNREATKRGNSFFYFRKDEDTLAIPEADARSGGYREFAQPNEIERFGLETAESMAKERADKLVALKQAIIDAKLPVHHYEAKWSEAEKRLIGLEKFGERVYKDLLQSLSDDPELAVHFADDRTATPDEFADECDQMESFIEERVDQYILGSREPLMNEMLAFANTEGTPNILVLTGAPGSGKSALLAKFCRSLPVSSSPSLLVSHFVGASTGSTDLRRTLRRLCHEVAKAAGNTEPLPLDIKELITHFQKLLTEAAGRQRVILVFDALNQFDTTDGAHWLNWLPRELSPGVRLVASVIAPAEGEKEHQTLAILRNRKDVRVEALKPLNETDTLAIIEGYLKRYSKRLSEEQIAALLAKPAGRLPLYVLTALEELRTLGTYEEITARIRTLPGDARALFGWILTERLARDPGFRDREGRPCGAALVEKFAACLGVSRHGLSPAELTALLDPGDPLGNVAALLRLLRPYLMRRGELLDFYHAQFREAAVTTHLDTPEKQRAAHQSVATCLQAFADPHRDGQCRDATPHALSELPHHQTRAEAWPDLIASLENIFFLEAKVTHGMAFDLAADFSASVNALPLDDLRRERLRLLTEALRRDIYFIARHAIDYPQGLFQCLWNSGWWYDCAEAAQYYEDENGLRDSSDNKLNSLIDCWRSEREAAFSRFTLLRSVRPPPMHLGTAQLAFLRGHDRGVNSVAFSPDGRRILSGSDDRTVRLWDRATGAELAVLSGHENLVYSVAFSPDGRRILSGSADQTVGLWDAASGAQLTVLRGHKGSVTCVAFSPDGRRILSGSDDRTVRLWDAASGAELVVLRGHEAHVSSVVFSPDGRCILSGAGSAFESNDNTVRLWDATTGAEIAVLHGHKGTVNSVAFSPDGRRILSGSNDKTLRLWDAASGAELAVLNRHESLVTCVAFSPDGRRILSGSDDMTLRVWDSGNGNQIAVLRGHERWVKSVAFSPDGQSILSGSPDKTVRLWDSVSGANLVVLREHEMSVSSLAFSPDGRCILSGSWDGTIRLWDAASGKQITIVRKGNTPVRSVAFSPDGRRILCGLDDHTVQIWSAVSCTQLEILRGHERYVESVAFSSDGKSILSGSGDRTMRLWDADSGDELAVFRGHEHAVISVAFSSDGKRLASGSWDKTVRLWDAESGVQLTVLCGHEGWVWNVAFSPDGRHILSRSDDQTVRVWDSQSGECLEILEGSGDIISIAAGATAFPWRVITRNGEAVVEPSAGGPSVAWFPDALSHIATHPDGRLWAGAVGRHLVLLRLEGR